MQCIVGYCYKYSHATYVVLWSGSHSYFPPRPTDTQGKRHDERSAPWTAAPVRIQQILGISQRRMEQERARQRDVCKCIILIGQERALETRAVCWCARQNVHFEDQSEGSSISIPIALRSTATDHHTPRRRKIGEPKHGAFYFFPSGSSIFL